MDMVGEWSLPSRGAWIEIYYADVVLSSAAASLPSRGAWIEIRPCPER